MLERKENFWRITLDYDQNVIIYFFQMRHEYFLSELTLLSVGIPPVYTGAAPSCRHTAAASATSAPRPRWGPAQSPRIHPGVGRGWRVAYLTSFYIKCPYVDWKSGLLSSYLGTLKQQKKFPEGVDIFTYTCTIVLVLHSVREQFMPCTK